MTGPEGGFYSATDADSEGEEGKFFVWTPAEVEAVLGPEEAGRLCAFYDITDEGNWEGKSIPHTPRSVERVASRLGVTVEAFRQSIEDGRARLYEARRQRVPPGLDDKVLTAWNGMMLGAMAEGARVLGESRYLAAAARAADFLLAALRRPDGRLLRTYRAGKAHLDAYLEDYAFLAEGLLDLYEAGGDIRYLRDATGLAERILADFGDRGGRLLSTRRGTTRRSSSGTRTAPTAPSPAPTPWPPRCSPGCPATWTGPTSGKRAVGAIQAYGRPIAQHPRAFCRSLAVVDFLLEGPVELALVGTPGAAGFEALRGALARRFLPNRIVAHHDPAGTPPPTCRCFAGRASSTGRRPCTSAGTSPARRR